MVGRLRTAYRGLSVIFAIFEGEFFPGGDFATMFVVFTSFIMRDYIYKEHKCLKIIALAWI